VMYTAASVPRYSVFFGFKDTNSRTIGIASFAHAIPLR
jgi:hypothetical protein